MKVLYVTGSCLTRNTSANMSHNSFVKGLIDNGCEVDILMAKESWGQLDNALPIWKSANYYSYSSIGVADHIKKRLKKIEGNGESPKSVENISSDNLQKNQSKSLKMWAREVGKRWFYKLFKPDPLYPLEKNWLRRARDFKNDLEYDLVLSNSSPAASHKLVEMLLKSDRIKTKRWVQVWEDPWYFDLYGGHSEEIREEEYNLLKAASEVYYVSPLTLLYQKKNYPICADKMKCVPLPYLDLESEKVEMNTKEIVCGYFGDYYSVTRNIKPFYEVAKKLGIKSYIYGDSDLYLPPDENVKVSGRVTLDVLAEIQKKANVLVHLSNLKGGQIPGKIYHYSATNKPILFILDGEKEEKEYLYNFFSKFDRYIFCNNDTNSIESVLRSFELKEYDRVTDFSPKDVVEVILNKESLC